MKIEVIDFKVDKYKFFLIGIDMVSVIFNYVLEIGFMMYSINRVIVYVFEEENIF